MPYIADFLRVPYDPLIDALINRLRKDGFHPGTVTYIIYKIIRAMFLEDQGYQIITEIRGILWGTVSEFDRRLAHPYEDDKIKENGDVE
jgi:hypothetical protein